jgi:hypothetical protein
VTLKSDQFREVYLISGIDPDKLSDSQKRFIEKIFTLLIRKCSQEDKSIGSLGEALREIADVVRDDPLFQDDNPADPSLSSSE